MRHASSGSHFDFWVAVLTAVTTSVAFGIAVATPPKSGPFCVDTCVGYPYTDFAAYIPRDFFWLYAGLLPAPLFVMVVNGIHARAAATTKRFSQLASAFSMMAAALLTADYFIQLRVIQPAVLNREVDGLAPLTQYNPHGLFIALEEAGYLLMAIAFGFAAAALPAQHALLRIVRRIFVAGAVAVLLLFVGLSIGYGFAIEYRFEVAAISVDWMVLIVTGTLLAHAYRSASEVFGPLETVQTAETTRRQ
jgi:hypothetical protein